MYTNIPQQYVSINLLEIRSKIIFSYLALCIFVFKGFYSSIYKILMENITFFLILKVWLMDLWKLGKICAYIDRSLVVGLTVCPFSSIIEEGYLLSSMSCLVIGSSPDNGVNYWFYLVWCESSPIRKWLVIALLLVSLLAKWACIAWLIIVVASRIHRYDWWLLSPVVACPAPPGAMKVYQ